MAANLHPRRNIVTLAVLSLAAVLGAGCLHSPNMEACHPTGAESACWVSSEVSERSGNEYVVVERVTVGDVCDRIEIESSTFDANAVLRERVVEVRRCGVTDRRTEYEYDLDRGVISTRIELDTNHDDQFDVVRSYERPMNDEQRELLAHATPPRHLGRTAGASTTLQPSRPALAGVSRTP